MNINISSKQLAFLQKKFGIVDPTPLVQKVVEGWIISEVGRFHDSLKLTVDEQIDDINAKMNKNG